MTKVPREKVVGIRPPKRLKGKQVAVLPHADGGAVLLLLDEAGVLYARQDNGWVALDMFTAPMETIL